MEPNQAEYDVDECPHFVSPAKDCVRCDSRQHMVMKCFKCSLDGGQTWHLIEGEKATCRKCGTVRSVVLIDGDMGIATDE